MRERWGADEGGCDEMKWGILGRYGVGNFGFWPFFVAWWQSCFCAVKWALLVLREWIFRYMCDFVPKFPVHFLFYSEICSGKKCFEVNI